MNLNLKNKVVIITGASRGIGKSIAKGFFDNNCKVALISRNKKDLIDTKNVIGAKSNNIQLFPCDISNFSDVQNVIDKVIKYYGNIDILINNAGITKDNLILRMKEEDWDTVVDVNLKGCFNTVKAVVKQMIRNKKGSIINISSVIGLIGNAGQTNYAASKAGIFGLTKSLAKELGSRNITVNAIAPGYVQTSMTEKLSTNIKNDLYKNIPLKRLGSAEDIANLVLFLSSEKASYITGQIMNVDGGMVT
ncbi:MAG: 3-oxoacyl-[acyl-carrier-protein] reductase [Candidatus Neomarinimicrobiota bacterium]|nr:3-oxoacyl-[acyl-carrier-protein] reductase [Candidatus Neomarinimicrobiota bacterium]